MDVIYKYIYHELKIYKAHFIGFSLGVSQIIISESINKYIKMKTIILLDGGIIFSDYKQRKINLTESSYIENPFKKQLSNSSIINRYNKEEVLKCRLSVLLNEDIYFPVSYIKSLDKLLRDRETIIQYCKKINTPLFGVISDEGSLNNHRTILTAINTSANPIVFNRMIGFSHLDIICHPTNKEKLYPKILRFIEEYV